MTASFPVKAPKKLIEVAMPLDAINKAAVEEKAVPRRGHPQTLHYWWARRPLAAARAVLFAQMVNDPGFQRGEGFQFGKNKKDAAKERARLFAIMEELAKWENTNNEKILQSAQDEINKSWQDVCKLNSNHPDAAQLFDPLKPPSVYDPFAGGGTIPLEAFRLGRSVMASDLNPVATLINIAMLEVPARFNNMEYVHPSESLASDRSYLPLDVNLSGERKNGLAEDIWFYGQLILNETKRQLSFAYPEARVTTQMLDSQPNLKSFVGKDLTVLAWRWARSVRSPNPAFSHAKVPLISSFVLTERSGQGAYLKPVINGDSYRFEVAFGEIPEAARQGTKPPGKGAGFRCILSGAAIEGSYIKSEGQAGRLDSTMVAILAESSGGRVYLPATAEHEKVARAAKSNLRPSQKMLGKSADQLPLYGMHDYADIFTDRQLLMMSTFAENITKVHGCIQKQALAAGLSDDDRTFLQGGRGARAYADAISLYLSCALSRLATYNNTCCFWNIKGGSVTFIFARQAIAMCWDFIEINPLAKMSGNWEGAVDWVCDVVRNLPSRGTAAVWQGNATEATPTVPPVVISTDPPYYDNIGYADLSDFFTYGFVNH